MKISFIIIAVALIGTLAKDANASNSLGYGRIIGALAGIMIKDIFGTTSYDACIWRADNVVSGFFNMHKYDIFLHYSHESLYAKFWEKYPEYRCL